MNRSESVAKVSAALVLACGELENVVAEKVNPHFRSKYASLPAMLDAVRPVLAKHGLAVVQLATSESEAPYRIGVETILLHSSGEYLGHTILVSPQKADPQGAGSALTYCRRYALAAALGIGQEDDDGNHASARPAAPRRKEPEPPREEEAPAPKDARFTNGVITDAQGKRLWALAAERAKALDGVSRTDIVRDVLFRRGIEHTAEVPKAAYEAICAEVSAWDVPTGTADAEGEPF